MKRIPKFVISSLSKPLDMSVMNVTKQAEKKPENPLVKEVDTLLAQMDTLYKDLVRIDYYEGKQAFAMNKVAMQRDSLKLIRDKLAG